MFLAGKDERGPSSLNQTDKHWSCLKGNVWGTSASERRGGTRKGFSERIDTTSNRTEPVRVQELCESRGGRPGLPVLMSLMVSVDVKQH